MPQSKFVGATGGGGEFCGKEITEAESRFEDWLSAEGWHKDDEGNMEAESLISDYLGGTPNDEEHEKALQQHAREMGRDPAGKSPCGAESLSCGEWKTGKGVCIPPFPSRSD